MDGLRTLRLLRGAGGGIFALRRPRPYSRRWRGGRCDACGIDHHLRPCRDQQERRRGGLRRGAPLRPSRNGRIGFKPPYSKREPRRKARRGAIVYRRLFLRVKRFQSSNSISRRPERRGVPSRCKNREAPIGGSHEGQIAMRRLCEV